MKKLGLFVLGVATTVITHTGCKKPYINCPKPFPEKENVFRDSMNYILLDEGYYNQVSGQENILNIPIDSNRLNNINLEFYGSIALQNEHAPFNVDITFGKAFHSSHPWAPDTTFSVNEADKDPNATVEISHADHSPIISDTIVDPQTQKLSVNNYDTIRLTANEIVVSDFDKNHGTLSKGETAHFGAFFNKGSSIKVHDKIYQILP